VNLELFVSIGFLENESFQDSFNETPWILILVETALKKQQLSYGARWLDCTDVPSIFFFFSPNAWTNKGLQLKCEIVLLPNFYRTGHANISPAAMNLPAIYRLRYVKAVWTLPYLDTLTKKTSHWFDKFQTIEIFFGELLFF